MRALLAGCALLLALLVGACVVLLGSESGLRWLLALGQRLAPGELQVDAAEGRVLGHLRLRGLRYRSPELDLGLEELELRWHPQELLQGTLHVALLRVVGASLHTAGDGPERPATPPGDGPPELRLPLALQLDRVTLERLSQASGEAPPTTVLEALELRGLRLDPMLHLAELQARGPSWWLKAAGSAEPYANWPLDLRLDWRAELAQRGTLTGSGRLQGDAGRLTLVQRLSGLAHGLLRAELREPFGTLAWDLSLGLEPSPLPELQGAELAGRLDASGDLQRARAEGELGLALADSGPLLASFGLDADAAALQLERLQIRAPQAGALLELAGSVALAELAADLQGSWRELRWPLLGEPQVQSARGWLQLQGGIEDLRAELETVLSSPLLEAPEAPAPPLSLRLLATRDGRMVRLRQLSIDAPDSPLRLRVEGRFEPDSGRYAAAGDWTALRWPLSGEPQVQSPDGRFQAEGTGPDFQLQLNGHLRAAALAAEGALPTLSLAARASGGERLRLESLSIRDLASDAALDLEGSVEPTSQLFSAAGHWQSLRWPLFGPAAIRSDTGRLTAEGSPDDYRAELSLDLAGPQVPPSQWRLRADGDRSSVQLEQLVGDLLGGRLLAQGSADWSAAPAWRAEINGEDLQPEQQWPGLPGRLAFRLEGEGVVAERATTSLRLQSLSGTLLEQPLAGRGELSLSGQTVEVPALTLALGGNRLQAAGRLDQHWALDWTLEAPQLAALAPTLGGRIGAQGKLTGPRDRPRLQLSLDGAELSAGDARIARVRGHGIVDLSGGERSQAELAASDIAAGGMRWQKVRLEAQGLPEQHALALSATGDVALEARLSGSLDPAAGSWNGRLERLELQQAEAGRWRLRTPAALAASAGALSLAQTCLASGPARVCLSAERGAEGNGRAELALQSLPMTRLAPLLPAGLELQGVLAVTGQGTWSAAGVPSGNARVQLDDAQLALATTGDEPLRLELADARVDAELEPQEAQLRLHLVLVDRGQLSGRLDVADPLAAPALQGTLTGYLSSLDFLPLLVPAIAAADGRLDLDLQLAGALAQPRLGGDLTVSGFQAELPAVGIALRDGRARLNGGDDGRLRLAASARSGPGTLTVQGDLNPGAQMASLRISGDDVQAVDIHALSARVSPRLQVRAEPAAISVSGEVLVPYARIQPPERPGAVSPSADTVIVGADAEEEATAGGGPAVTADVTVRLGDDVQVEAYGLTARLEGAMRIRQEPGRAAQGSGAVQVAAGTYEIFGQSLEIERGRVLFAGPLTSPGLDVRAVRRVDEVVAGVMVSGPIRQPETQVFSEPAMPQASALSYLLFGRPPASGAGSGEGQMLSQALSALAATGGNRLGERLAGGLGLDEITFDSGSTAEDTTVAVGKYLTPKLYFRYGVGLLEPVSAFLVRYRLSDRFSVETFTGSEASGADINFELER